DASCNGQSWTLTNASNVVVASGTMSGTGTASGDYMPLAYNYKITFSSVTGVGNYTLTVPNVTPVTIRILCKPYQSFLPMILRTIRVRRSGSADALDHAYSHGKDSSAVIWRRNGTNNGSWSVDASNTKVNMLGGHYDAGDYIKFTLTEAYMVYHLLRSYQSAPSLFDGVKTYSTTGYDDLLDECKWGLDYLMGSQPSTAEFIIQMGGAADHQQWPQRLPENDALNGSRECYSIRSKTQMGMTAAALALGAKVFSDKGYTVLANAYRNKAISIYASAKASTINSAWWEGGGEVFYADNTPSDNMQLAAIELYMLTGTASYLTDATNAIAATGAAGWSSWGDVNMQAHLRTLTFAGAAGTQLTNDLTTFRSNAQRVNNLWGIPHESVWGSNASQMSVAHASLSHKLTTGITTYSFIAQQVIDYLFGRNPWGICFIANTTYSPSITTSYAPIYKLQPSKFPYGEIAAGPAPAADHAAQTTYFSPAHNPNLWFKNFNTSTFTFFEQAGD
ncbi:MAG: glycoside hydrolase family 9 protein, partial [Cytophagales bacterium]|nr:glycoside hydrolase family 9 protein [Cytophagales bacterium]